MYRVVAADLPYIFQFGFGYRLFIGDYRRTFEDCLCKFLFFNRRQYVRNGRLVCGVSGELQLAVEGQKMYSVLAAVFLFKLADARVYLFERTV